MEFINPNEIGAKISTLILESGSFFYAITPYIDISNWKKILHNLEIIKKKGVVVKFYVREIKDRDRDALKKLDIELHIIDRLHTKLYLNECQAIFTSMNLYEYSDINSMDLAIKFTERERYAYFFDYYKKYIENCEKKINEIPKYFSSNYPTKIISNSKIDYLYDFLVKKFPTYRIIKSNTVKKYLFSKDLIPLFDIDIEENQIKLTYPYSITKRRKEHISELIKNFTTFPPRKKGNFDYSRYYWTISLNGKSNMDIYNMIIKLKELPIDQNEILLPKRKLELSTR